MIKLFLIVLGIVAVCVALLSVRLFVGREFVHTHVEGNKELHRRGIKCARALDPQMRSEGIRTTHDSPSRAQ